MYFLILLRVQSTLPFIQHVFIEKLLCFKLSLGQNIALGGCGIHNTSAVVFNLSPKALAHAKCLILLLDQIET